MVLVAIVVYDRQQNVARWLNVWKKCNTGTARLVFIHNVDKTPVVPWEEVDGVLHIYRKNIGFDIGALQDVALGRLPGFPAMADNDRLLWCTDDVMPMTPHFLELFEQAMQDGVGVACMEISREVAPHIRTTGFYLLMGLLRSLTFPADPVVTKQHCYEFEHRSKKTLLNQVQAKGLKAVQVAPIETSPLWDTGHRSRLARLRYDRREKEFQKVFQGIQPTKTREEVAFICPVYNTFPEIISSLINQTYPYWKLYLVHDGPNTQGLRDLIKQVGDTRIQYVETPVRVGNWGHSYRREYLRDKELGDYVVITNADNHHVPTYIEYMLAGFKNPGVVATYCSHMVHNYKAHQVIPCTLKRGYLDCAGVMVRSSVAKTVGWGNVNEHSADWLYFEDIAKAYGWSKFVKIEGCLLIHN